jgi:hypothetical protein
MQKLFAAMAKAFPEIEGATKDRTNPAFKSKYADLASVVDALKPALVAHDLFFTQHTHEQQGGVCIETMVHHSSGEGMSFGKLFVPATKQDAQGYGSALSYARRYSLMTAFGVCPEDDDGNAASLARRPAVENAISDSQYAQLVTLLEQSSSDTLGFCKFYKTPSVKELAADKFEHAFKSLTNKLSQRDAA